MTDRTVSLPSARGPVAPNARDIATMAAGAAPVVDTINIDKSSDVHIGPKIVSVVQNIDNAEKVKVRILGLELMCYLNRSRRLRYSMTVVICWSMIICAAFVAYVSYALLCVRPTRVDIGINATWYMRRSEWRAEQPFAIDYLKLPVDYVIIGNSEYTYCDNRVNCISTIRFLQKNHIYRGLSDLEPNFLVGGNGYILEGRGANVEGAMLTGWNHKIISIMFLGDYSVNRDQVDDAQINNLQITLDRLMKMGILCPEYVLLAHCQISRTNDPGPNIRRILGRFPHWNPFNIEVCQNS